MLLLQIAIQHDFCPVHSERVKLVEKHDIVKIIFDNIQSYCSHKHCVFNFIRIVYSNSCCYNFPVMISLVMWNWINVQLRSHLNWISYHRKLGYRLQLESMSKIAEQWGAPTYSKASWPSPLRIDPTANPDQNGDHAHEAALKYIPVNIPSPQPLPLWPYH